MANTIRRRTLAAASAAALLAANLASLSSAAAFQGNAIAVRIAGPSVTYEVAGCPGSDVAPDGHGVSFSTIRPDGSSLSGSGVQVADGVFTLTSDVRADSLDGAYQVTASCLDAASASVFDYSPATFWVADGSPSLQQPAAPESDTEGDDADSPVTAPDDSTEAAATETPTTTADPESSPSDTSADADSNNDENTPPVADGAETPSSSAAAVQVDTATVSANDILTTWVNGCPPSVNGVASAVVFTVTDPTGAAKDVSADTPDADGSFSAAIRVPETPVLGSYDVDAGCGVYEADTFVARRSYTKTQFEVVPAVGLEGTAEPEQSAEAAEAAEAEQSNSQDAKEQATETPATTPQAVDRVVASQPAIGFTG